MNFNRLGRRTKRTETLGGVTTETWFFSNGWNVELERNATNLTKRMTWGLDLSQSLQGAGGVGGLVMVEDLTSGTPVQHFPTYDGNGNITAWVNASGSVVARQRYDAFGNIIQQIGTAPSNYGFSTKPMDQVTGLYYYGYRYYDPVTGRWPSRDPIGERGGVNLHKFLRNDSINKIDFLGQVDLVVSMPLGEGITGQYKSSVVEIDLDLMISTAMEIDPVNETVIVSNGQPILNGEFGQEESVTLGPVKGTLTAIGAEATNNKSWLSSSPAPVWETVTYLDPPSLNLPHYKKCVKFKLNAQAAVQFTFKAEVEAGFVIPAIGIEFSVGGSHSKTVQKAYFPSKMVEVCFPINPYTGKFADAYSVNLED